MDDSVKKLIIICVCIVLCVGIVVIGISAVLSSNTSVNQDSINATNNSSVNNTTGNNTTNISSNNKNSNSVSNQKTNTVSNSKSSSSNVEDGPQYGPDADVDYSDVTINPESYQGQTLTGHDSKGNQYAMYDGKWKSSTG